MRLATAVLLLVLAVVQAELWLGDGGLPQARGLQARLDAQHQRNAAQRRSNQRLQAEVDDLRTGLEMVEERARYELGMIGQNEIYVLLDQRRNALPRDKP